MLMEFYGRECIHCMRMAPLIDKLEKEIGVKFARYEVWHDEANAKKLEGYAKEECEGVPFYVNTEMGKNICGEASYEELKSWAMAK